MGLFKKAFQIFTLPALVVRDIVSKPTSRTLNERLEKAVDGNLVLSARYALKKGANATYKVCLLTAAKNGNAPMIAALLKHGANVDQTYWSYQNTDKEKLRFTGTALSFAAKEGYTEAVRVLLANKADPWVVEETMATPMAGGTPVVTKLDVMNMVTKNCYDDITALLKESRAKNPQSPPTPPAPVATQPPATPDFNTTAAPNVTTDDDIVVSGPLKLKNSAALQQ